MVTDKRWRSLFLVLGVGATIWVGYLARAVVTPLVAALLLAYVLDPIVRFLQRRGLSRTVASAGVVVVALATLLGAAVLSVQRAVQEGGVLYERVTGEPHYVGEDPASALAALAGTDTAKATVDRARARIRPTFHPDRLGFFLDLDGDGQQQADEPSVDGEDRSLAIAVLAAASGDEGLARDWHAMRAAKWQGKAIWFVDEDMDGIYDAGYARRGVDRVEEILAEYELEGQFKDLLDQAADLGPEIASTAGDVLGRVVEGGRTAAGTALGLLTLLLLFPIYLYFALVNLERVWKVGVAHLPRDTRADVVHLLMRIHVTLSHFFRGRLVVLLLKWAMLLVAFLGFGVPFAFVCATFAALAALVPVIGGPAGAIPPLLLALSSGHSTGGMVGLLGVLVLIEVIEGYVLIPGMIGKEVGLHPLTVLVSTFIAGDLLGIFGMLIAIPLAAVVKILFGELVLPEIRARAGIEEDGSGGESGDAGGGEEEPTPGGTG